MTQNTYTRIQFQNAITERDRRAQDVADFRTITTDDLPQVPPNCNYSCIAVEVSRWDNSKFILRGAIGSECFTREVGPNFPLTQYMQTFQHVYGIGAL